MKDDVLRLDAKYEESIRLTYNYALLMFMRLKNIRDNFEAIENFDDITKEVYRDSIIKIYLDQEQKEWQNLIQI